MSPLVYALLWALVAACPLEEWLAPDIIVLDSHCDTPLDLAKGAQLGGDDPKIQVSIPRLREGGVGAQYLACWVKQGDLTDAGRRAAKRRVDQLIDISLAQIAANDSACGLAFSAEEVRSLHRQGKIAFLLGVENGYGIGLDLGVLDEYRQKGVSYLTLCHSKNNDICDSSSDKSGPRWHGLSPFGREVVAKMNALGLLIDISHASEKTFWDVIEFSQAPVVCTHSGSKSIYGHNRNLTDSQMRALAEHGGVVQVCAVDDFLRRDGKNATIADFMRHLLHAIEVAGIDHVGIGTDFDGGGGVKGFNGSEDFASVAQLLREQGFSERDLAKVLGGNFLRVLGEAQAAATHSRAVPLSR